MSKRSLKPGTMLNPLPVVMVSCGKEESEYNIMTVAWTGIINSEPPMTYVSIRKSRLSHEIIKKNATFVINLCNEKLVKTVDYCGVVSGRDINKFKEMRLTAIKGEKTGCVMIEECPFNIECKVTNIVEYGSHDMFVAEIVGVHADEALFSRSDKLLFEKADLVVYNHGDYFALEKTSLGRFGHSVMKEKTKKRLAGENRARLRTKKR